LNSLVKDLNKVTQNNARNITPKETLQYFSQDLKEAVDQYKAPITKLSITLNPNNLGEVEVTLIQRGNNLHINFNSNTNAMNLFIQNQAEFKNSLVNMGFTGLEMNFSDQGKREQNQNQGKNRSGYGFKDALDGKNESEKVNLELVLAKYF
ncbi:flagellar hook-length control protein FliK, partial [Campylobacter jejuni]|nr:flagellar hook-length control protein FliK [Campylobacter jejuni]